MYKIGDDLRQDSLITCVFQLMESIWLDAGLDLRMRTFKVFPTERNKGFIELVPVRVLYFFSGGKISRVLTLVYDYCFLTYFDFNEGMLSYFNL